MTSTRNALLWSFGERYLNVIVALISSMILARLLTPSEIGKFSLCASAVAVAGTVRDFGVSEYIIQAKELSIKRLRGAFAVALTSAWSMGAAVFFLRGPFATFYSEPELIGLFGILSLNFLFIPLASSGFAMLNREMAFQKIFIIKITAALAHAVASIGLAWAGHGAQSLAWASVVSVVTYSIVVTLVRPQGSLLLPSFRASAEPLQYGVYSVTGRLIDTLTANAHEFVIAKLFGFSSVGVFSRAKGLVDILAINISAATSGVVLPSMANAHRVNADVKHTFARATAIFTSIAWPFYGFLGVAAPEIVHVMFGPQWNAAAPIAATLALAFVPSALFALSPPTLAALGQVKRRLRISLQFNPIHLAALGLFSLFGGFSMIPLAWLITNSVLLVLHTKHLRSVLNANLVELYALASGSALLAVACSACFWLSLTITRNLDLLTLPALLIAAGSGSAVWLVLVRLLNLPISEELIRILRRKH